MFQAPNMAMKRIFLVFVDELEVFLLCINQQIMKLSLCSNYNLLCKCYITERKVN
jgi:hypothetical protein